MLETFSTLLLLRMGFLGDLTKVSLTLLGFATNLNPNWCSRYASGAYRAILKISFHYSLFTVNLSKFLTWLFLAPIYNSKTT